MIDSFGTVFCRRLSITYLRCIFRVAQCILVSFSTGSLARGGERQRRIVYYQGNKMSLEPKTWTIGLYIYTATSRPADRMRSRSKYD